MGDTALPQALDAIAVSEAATAEPVAEAMERLFSAMQNRIVNALADGDLRTATLSTLVLMGATRLDRATKLSQQQQFFDNLRL